LALEDRAAVVRIRRAVVVEVAEEIRITPIPRAEEHRVEIGHGGALVLVRADEPHALHRAEGEELRAHRHFLERGKRVRLRLGHAVNVDVGREAELRAGLLEPLAHRGELSGVDGEILGNGEGGRGGHARTLTRVKQCRNRKVWLYGGPYTLPAS